MSKNSEALKLPKFHDIPTIKTWHDIEALPNFTEIVDPKRVELVDLITHYHCYPERPCGLAGCRTNHNEGFVAIDAKGRLFKMGGCCGKNLFPEKFKTLRSGLTRRMNEQAARNELIEAQKSSQEMAQKVESTLNHLVGLRPIKQWYSYIHKIASTGFECKTIERLDLRCKQQKPVITVTRQVDESLDERDREILEVSGHEERYVEDMVHIIAGIGAFNSYKKIHPNKLSKLLNETMDFQTVDFNHLNRDRIMHWQRWLGAFMRKLKEIENVAEDCRRFCNKDNLDAIRKFKHYL